MKMALKFKLSFFLALALGLCSLSLLAQEENFSAQELQELKQQPQHQDLNLEDDKTLIIEVDGKSSSKSMPSSSAASKAKPETNKVAKDKNEDDALNFNFLYFIIQRFKMSDIVDD